MCLSSSKAGRRFQGTCREGRAPASSEMPKLGTPAQWEKRGGLGIFSTCLVQVFPGFLIYCGNGIQKVLLRTFLFHPTRRPWSWPNGSKMAKNSVLVVFSHSYLVEHMKCLLLPTPSGHYYDLNEPWNTPIRSDSDPHSAPESPKKAQKDQNEHLDGKRGWGGGFRPNSWSDPKYCTVLGSLAKTGQLLTNTLFPRPPN